MADYTVMHYRNVLSHRRPHICDKTVLSYSFIVVMRSAIGRYGSIGYRYGANSRVELRSIYSCRRRYCWVVFSAASPAV